MSEEQKVRCGQLFDIKMMFNGKSYVGFHDKNKDFNVHWTEILTLDNVKWDVLINKLSNELNDRLA